MSKSLFCRCHVWVIYCLSTTIAYKRCITEREEKAQFTYKSHSVCGLWSCRRLGVTLTSNLRTLISVLTQASRMRLLPNRKSQ